MKSQNNTTPRQAHRSSRSPPCRTLLLTLALVASISNSASAFLAAPASTNLLAHGRIATASSAATSNEDVFDSLGLVERARAVLEKSKAKLAEQEERAAASAAIKTTAAPEKNTPFFAQRSVSRDQVVKSKDDKTGLITADGEVMAAISEQEDWEMRSLSEVFENETDENGDDYRYYSAASQHIAERDLAASVWNMRKTLQTDDYFKIFDKRNRFIGDLE